jgi:hypothetical protein
MDELERQIEADYQRDKPLLNGSVTVREIYALAWLKGRTAGLNAGMEFAVIGEHINEPLLESVLEAQRQTS